MFTIVDHLSDLADGFRTWEPPIYVNIQHVRRPPGSENERSLKKTQHILGKLKHNKYTFVVIQEDINIRNTTIYIRYYRNIQYNPKHLRKLYTLIAKNFGLLIFGNCKFRTLNYR
jgi:hypothetical protein